MGGFWGVGASLTMESAPRRWRGLLSGLLQGGYPLGYLLAAVAARLILPAWGWRAMFWAGLVPGVITMLIAYKSPQSEAWKQHRVPSVWGILRVVCDHRKSFSYLVVMLTLMIGLSHGTQDLYPDFLKTAHHISPNVVAYLAMFYNVGALLGTISVGHTSERLGRRRSIICSLSLCAVVIPLWAFGHSLTILALGAFLMQVGVQGAWGVVPAHLNELSPDAVRSLFPGFVYQLGVLFGSPTNTIEYALRDRIGYQWALTVFEGCTILALVIVFALGPEHNDSVSAKIAAQRGGMRYLKGLCLDVWVGIAGVDGRSATRSRKQIWYIDVGICAFPPESISAKAGSKRHSGAGFKNPAYFPAA